MTNSQVFLFLITRQAGVDCDDCIRIPVLCNVSVSVPLSEEEALLQDEETFNEV